MYIHYKEIGPFLESPLFFVAACAITLLIVLILFATDSRGSQDHARDFFNS